MVEFKLIPKEFSVIRKLPASTQNVQVLLTNSSDWFYNRYLGAFSDHLLNGYLTQLSVFSDINSLAEIPIPDYEIGESKTSALTKTLNMEWKSPRYQLEFYKTKGIASVNSEAWNLVGALSLLNPQGYPYRTFNALDLYTDLLALPLEEGESLGCAVKDVGHGMLQTMDTVTIHGNWKQELYSIQPDYQPLLITGSTISNVTQYTDNIQIAATTAKSQRLSTRPTRLSGYVRNSGTANTVYMKYDSNVSATNYDAVLAPGVTVQLPQAYTGEVWVIAGASTSAVMVSETYRIAAG